MMTFLTLDAYEKPKVLSEEEAFNVEAIKNGDVISLKIELGKDIYLYDEQLHISITSPITQSLDKEIKRPKPIEYDGFIVHLQSPSFLIPLNIIKKYVSSGEFTIALEFQGCSKSGICYSPMKKEFTYNLGGDSVLDSKVKEDLSEQDKIADTFKTSSFGFVILSFFGFGILLSLTPCIFPMIPILSSIIVSQSQNMTTKKSFILSLVYVLAMSVAYTLAGVLAGLFGSNLQATFQNPWIISVFSLIFVALAFSMFGFYNLQLPSFIQSSLTKKSDQMQGHGVFGVAVMGFLSALIVGPCVAAPLAGALIYIGQSGDAFLGGAALFAMSLGMGLPLIAVGMSAGKFMPRPGVWMDNVKAVFGVVMLGVAIWMLSRIIPANITMLLSAFLILASAIYMKALEPLENPTSGWAKLRKTIAIIFLVYGIALFIGVLSGSSNLLKPLEKSFTSSTQTLSSKGLDFEKITTIKELENAIKNSSKPVMVDFYADWCVNCIELEQFTFSDARVQQRLSDFTLLKVDVTKNSKMDKELLKYYGLFGPPALIFYKNSEELKNLRIIGFKNADDFLNHIKSI
jgi:thiol:disulfide interchange protein DsbD